MSKETTKFFSNETLSKVLESWSISCEINFIRYLENYVYDLVGEDKILRITRADRKSSEQINEELNFISHLKEFGGAVCFPILNIERSYLISFESSGESYHACIFDKASGGRVDISSENLNMSLDLLGKQLGLFHSSVENFTFKVRPNWKNDTLFFRAKTALKNEETVYHTKFIETVNAIDAIEKDSTNFGAIHGDCHFGNFFFDKNQIQIFDFDDAHEGFFMYDLVIPVQGILLKAVSSPLELNLKESLQILKNSHQRLHSRFSFEKGHFDIFMKFRMLMCMGWYIELSTDSSLSEKLKASLIKLIPYCKQIIDLQSPYNEYFS